VADHHDLRGRGLRVLGAARGRDLPQARHGLSRALRLQRRDLRLCHAGGVPPAPDGRLGPRLSLRHLQSPRLGLERGLRLPALPLQPGAYARGDVLLHHDLALALHGGADPVGRQPREGRGDEDARSRRHVLPRLHRLFDRHAGHSPSRPSPGAERRVLERRLHHHLRPVWTSGWPEWWNWWLTLPIWPDPSLVYDSTGMATYGTEASAIVGGN
jgi:hypothetical protein